MAEAPRMTVEEVRALFDEAGLKGGGDVERYGQQVFDYLIQPGPIAPLILWRLREFCRVFGYPSSITLNPTTVEFSLFRRWSEAGEPDARREFSTVKLLHVGRDDEDTDVFVELAIDLLRFVVKDAGPNLGAFIVASPAT